MAAAESARRGWRLYLVGGAVRGLILRRAGLDIDLAVEGDAIELARAIATAPEDVTVHHRFNTACLKWGGHRIDLARSRQETYARPGALPAVRPGPIENDLFRRDFTVNAMAVSLNTDDWGHLIDCHGGYADLQNGQIRVLHHKSFIDDATRMWRAVRYEQRLDFHIERGTLALLKRDLPMLHTITSDRIRYELECVLLEAAPEKIFRRADELGLLRTWHPALEGDEWLSETCTGLRQLNEEPPPEAYLSLLTWRLSANQKEEFIAKLRLTRHQTRAIRGSGAILARRGVLNSSATAPSAVYRLLHGLTDDVLTAGRAALPHLAQQNIKKFVEEWRHIAPELTGEDLKRLGVGPGPDIKGLLEELRNLRLDGKVSTRRQEEAYVAARVSRRAEHPLP